MNKEQWYEELFENYGQKYDDESFAQGTVGECDFHRKRNQFRQIVEAAGCGMRNLGGIPLSYLLRITSCKGKGKKQEEETANTPIP